MKYRFGIIWLILLITGPVFAEERVYIVQKGDTFYSIARSFGIKSEDLMKLNGIKDPTKLQADQKLKIPGSQEEGGAHKSESALPGAYRVAKHDTLYSIARQHEVSLEALLMANSITSSYVLREGDMLIIPEEGKQPEQSAGQQSLALAQNSAPAADLETARFSEPKTLDTSISWPVTVRELSYMTGKLSGVMITGAQAEAVKSLTRGTVVSAGPYRGFGKVAIVQSAGGYLYVYGGCESLLVKEGDKVGPGSELGKLGLDGISAKAQLFFLVYRNNSPVDPARAPRGG